MLDTNLWPSVVSPWEVIFSKITNLLPGFEYYYEHRENYFLTLDPPKKYKLALK